VNVLGLLSVYAAGLSVNMALLSVNMALLSVYMLQCAMLTTCKCTLASAE